MNPDFLFALAAAILLVCPAAADAQALKLLHSFGPTMALTNAAPINEDGASPQGSLVLSGTALFGTTTTGGSWGLGTIFRMNLDGTGFTDLHTFAPKDGGNPSAGLVLSQGVLYGTTVNGGEGGFGTVFAMNTDGTGFKQLHSFAGDDGSYPYCDLVLVSNTLFGVTTAGGDDNAGTVFAVSVDGTGFTKLYSFSFGDGMDPYGGLTLSDEVLYGTTVGGGAWSAGTVFAIHTDGSGFANLYNFTGDIDGSGPYDRVVASSNVLYGVAIEAGSAADVGTIFRVGPDGFETLHAFVGADGAESGANLILCGRTLYGTAQLGGQSNVGTLFAVQTDGTGFTNLYNFTNSPDGAYPESGLLRVGNNLYGTTRAGGVSRNGTVFCLSLPTPPLLTLTRLETNLSLSWPSTVTATLQSTTNPGPSASWGPVSSGPVISNGQNTVSVPFLGPQQFYRLHL